MWSIWFIEMKMRNPDLPSDKLLKKALKEMQRLKSSKTEKFTYRRFVRNYKDHIIEMRKGILREGGVNCMPEINLLIILLFKNVPNYLWIRN